MIIEAIFTLLTGIINLIPFSLPQVSDGFQTALDMLLDGMLTSFNILAIFINIKFWFSCATAMLLLYNIKHIWNIFVYCINLIPSVNISYWK